MSTAQQHISDYDQGLAHTKALASEMGEKDFLRYVSALGIRIRHAFGTDGGCAAAMMIVGALAAVIAMEDDKTHTGGP